MQNVAELSLPDLLINEVGFEVDPHPGSQGASGEGLHLIAQRMHEPRPARDIGWRPFPGVRGLRGLPIEFTPAAA